MIIPAELICEAFNGDSDANAQLSDILEERGFKRTPVERYKQIVQDCARDYIVEVVEIIDRCHIHNLDMYEIDDFLLELQHDKFPKYWDKIEFIIRIEAIKSSWAEVAWNKKYRKAGFDCIFRLCFYHDLAVQVNKLYAAKYPNNDELFSLKTDFNENY